MGDQGLNLKLAQFEKSMGYIGRVSVCFMFSGLTECPLELESTDPGGNAGLNT